MAELIASIILFLTILMWIDLILSFISKSFNEDMIKGLQEQNEMIDRRRNNLKKLFKNLIRKFFKK